MEVEFDMSLIQLHNEQDWNLVKEQRNRIIIMKTARHALSVMKRLRNSKSLQLIMKAKRYIT